MGIGVDREPFLHRFSRSLRDGATVEGKLPAATRALEVDGVRGWLYSVSSALGDAFELFAFFDGSGYQVKVVRPDLEGHPDPHGCHVFGDGRICLGDAADGGMPTLEAAYAKSVVWCSGYSAYARTGRFPF
jgi:hypothetical protein